VLDAMLQRRLTGEPLAWITGFALFCGVAVRVHPGVYVPRPHSEGLALRALAALPRGGIAVDLCTGSGAVAMVLQRRRDVRVVAVDIAAEAVACARCNGVEAQVGDLFEPIPAELRGRVDVITAVVPYVPTDHLQWLQRDTFSFEEVRAYHGGADGAEVLRRVIGEAPAWLRRGGSLWLELGGEQAALIEPDLHRAGFSPPRLLHDEEGDLRGVGARLRGSDRRRR
jgi:release factor glutamine methyltransferase